MADHLESPSVTVTTDIISTAGVDTTYNVTLTNRTSDLPKQRRKWKAWFSHRKKQLKVSRRVIPPLSPQLQTQPQTPPQQTVINFTKLIAEENAIILFNTHAKRITIS